MHKKQGGYTAFYYLERGLQFVANGEFYPAIVDFNQALELAPDSVATYINRAIAYGNLEIWGFAFRDLNRALSIDDTNVEALVNLATSYLHLEEYELALESLARAEHFIGIQDKLEDDLLASLFNIKGIANCYLGRNEDALEAYTQSLSLTPKDAEIWGNLAEFYFMQDDLEESFAHSREALRLDPSFAEMHDNNGAIYASLGQYDKAIREYSKAIELKPDLASAYSDRAIVYFSAGKVDLALADLENSISLNPELPEPYFNRAIYYSEEGQTKLAIADFNHGIERKLKNIKIHYSTENMKYAQTTNLLHSIDKFLAPYAEIQQAYRRRSKNYYKEADIDIAIADLEEALERGLGKVLVYPWESHKI